MKQERLREFFKLWLGLLAGMVFLSFVAYFLMKFLVQGMHHYPMATVVAMIVLASGVCVYASSNRG